MIYLVAWLHILVSEENLLRLLNKMISNICWKGGGLGEPWFPLFCSEDFNAFGESESKTVRPPAVGGKAAVSVFDYILPKDFKFCQKTQNCYDDSAKKKLKVGKNPYDNLKF